MLTAMCFNYAVFKNIFQVLRSIYSVNLIIWSGLHISSGHFALMMFFTDKDETSALHHNLKLLISCNITREPIGISWCFALTNS